MAKVKGTQREQPSALEFMKTVVYERTNIKRVEKEGKDGTPVFAYWEYEENKYTYPQWYTKDSLENKLAIAELAEALTGGN